MKRDIENLSLTELINVHHYLMLSEHEKSDLQRESIEKVINEKISRAFEVRGEAPIFSHVVHFFQENGYSGKLAEQFYNYYSKQDWRDKNGKVVKNWKNKAKNTFFKNSSKKSGLWTDI